MISKSPGQVGSVILHLFENGPFTWGTNQFTALKALSPSSLMVYLILTGDKIEQASEMRSQDLKNTDRRAILPLLSSPASHVSSRSELDRWRPSRRRRVLSDPSQEGESTSRTASSAYRWEHIRSPTKGVMESLP